MDTLQTLTEIESELRLIRHLITSIRDYYKKGQQRGGDGTRVSTVHLARRISELEYIAVGLARELGGDDVI